jgi:hypothetical protein
VPSIQENWGDLAIPYYLLTNPGAGEGDHSINIAWNLVTLEPNRSIEVDYRIRVNATPLPSTLLLFGCGILGVAGLGLRKKIL